MEVRIRSAIEVFVQAIAKELYPSQLQNEINKQKRDYKGAVIGGLSPALAEALAQEVPFKPDLDDAKQRAKNQLESGIGVRLHGAYACYRAGKGLECLRHLLLAFSVIATALGWSEVTEYILEQNDFLIKKAQKIA